MEINNWVLKKHKKKIYIESNEYLPFYRNFLKKLNVFINEDFSTSSSFINWNKYVKKFTFFYDYEGCESEIEKLFFQSELSATNFLYMDFGYNNPVIRVKTKYFILNWYDFIKGAQYETTIVSDNGNCIMEFIKGYDLTSNFLIKL